MPIKKFEWTVKIRMDETWVADGFDLTQDRARDMVNKMVPYAHSWEFDAEVISSPSRRRIDIAQGS